MRPKRIHHDLPAALGTLAVPLGIALLLGACGDGNGRTVITASGHVEATDVRVSSKLPGTLIWFPMDEGDTVSAGQVIAHVDTTDVQLALDGALAEQAAADADLRLRLAGARAEDIAASRAQVEQAQAELDNAQADLQRMQGLLDLGSGAQKSRDDAKARRDVAQATLTAATERLRKMQALSRPEEIDAARARLRGAQARVAQLRQQLTDCTLTSPRSGVVSETLVEQGELLSAGATIAVVTDLSDTWLDVYVGEPDLARLRIGQPAEVRTDDGQTRQGTLTSIASTAEFTPRNVQTREERVKLVFKVRIKLPNADGLFKPGMPAEARLRAEGST